MSEEVPHRETEALQPSGLDLRAGLKWLGLIGGQATLLTALLFYFGWARTQGLLTHFGLDNNIVQLSWNEYILRSPNLVIRGVTLSCALLLVGTLVGTFVWRRVTARSSYQPWLARGVHALAAAALILGILGFYQVIRYSPVLPLTPLLLAVSAALFALGSTLSSRTDEQDTANRHPVLVGILLLCVTVLSVFWVASVYATEAGRELAREIERSTAIRPEVIVYSETGLSMSTPAVATMVQDSRYTHRYTGLRLLIYAPGKYLLIPDGWRRGRDPVYIIRDDPSIRVEIIR